MHHPLAINDSTKLLVTDILHLVFAFEELIPSFIGSAAAQSMAEQQDFTQDEIIEMANKHDQHHILSLFLNFLLYIH